MARMNSSFVAGFRPMRFEDGWGIVIPTSDADFPGMCKALEVAGYDDPRVATVGAARARIATSWNRSWTCVTPGGQPHAGRGDERFEAERVPFAMILSPEQLTARRARGRDRAVRGARPPHRRADADAAPPDEVPRHAGRAHGPARPGSASTPTTILADLGLRRRASPVSETLASSPSPSKPGWGWGQSTAGCSSAISRSLFFRILSRVPSGNSSTT